MKDLSIIIVNWNTKDLVLKCVESIKAIRPKVSYEIIVVDNASSEVLPESQDYKLLVNSENLGFAKACNIGINAAIGSFVLLLNSDTIVKTNALDDLVTFAKEKDDAGVVGAKLLNIDSTTQGSVTNFPNFSNAIKQYWFGQKKAFELYVPFGEEPREVEAVVGAAFLITPKALKKVGLMNEKYFMYYEDLDYCRRVINKGLKVYYLPKAQIIHYHGASGKKVVKSEFQWRRLIPSSKIYHGAIIHYLITFVIWSGQKWQKIFKNTQ